MESNDFATNKDSWDKKIDTAKNVAMKNFTSEIMANNYLNHFQSIFLRETLLIEVEDIPKGVELHQTWKIHKNYHVLEPQSGLTKGMVKT